MLSTHLLHPSNPYPLVRIAPTLSAFIQLKVEMLPAPALQDIPSKSHQSAHRHPAATTTHWQRRMRPLRPVTCQQAPPRLLSWALCRISTLKLERRKMAKMYINFHLWAGTAEFLGILEKKVKSHVLIVLWRGAVRVCVQIPVCVNFWRNQIWAPTVPVLNMLQHQQKWASAGMWDYSPRKCSCCH